MRFEPATLLRQHATGRGNLDEVRAVLRCAADLFGAFVRAGAAIARGEDRVDLGPKAADVAMATDNRQWRSGSDDARAGDDALGNCAAQREGGVLRRSCLADRGEAGPNGGERVLDAKDDAPFVGLYRVLPEIAAGIAGEVDVKVDQAGQHRLVAELDRPRAGRGGLDAVDDADDAPVGDGNRRGTPIAAARVAYDMSGMDDGGVGKRRRGKCER